MRAIVFVVLIGTAGPAMAARIWSGFPLSFPPPPEVVPPATVSWELATAGDQRVGLTITGVPIALPQIQYHIEEANAASYGFDWNAFVAAANDPAYTRSILTFSGVAKESPLIRDFEFGKFVPEFVNVIVYDYWYPYDAFGFVMFPDLQAFSIGYIIPEPNTLLLAGMFLLFHHVRNPTAARR
jgi:hypothetical protein